MPDQEPSADEIAVLADEIGRGEDKIPVPAQLVAEPPPDDEETKSLYERLKGMTIGERLKLALKGNREARVLLLRDSNRIIQRFVLRNPRISDDEIIMTCKNRNTESEILRMIADNREWTRNYQVKIALVQNPKTPLAISMTHIGGLLDRDIRFLAKSKNVPAAVSTKARRIVVEREFRR